MNTNTREPVPAPLKEAFAQLKTTLGLNNTHDLKNLEEWVEETQDLLRELYYAVETELERLQKNQLAEHVFYLQIPATLDYDNELYAQELEELITKHGIEKVTQHLRTLS